MEKIVGLVFWARKPRAFLTLELPETQICPGNSFWVRMTLVPQEQVHIRGATLELVYAETRFSRTVLDGYQEHVTDWVHVSEKFLCQWVAEAGVPVCREVEFRLPEEVPHSKQQDRPILGAWQVRAKVDVRRRLNLRSLRMLAVGNFGSSSAPDVEGKAILPWDQR